MTQSQPGGTLEALDGALVAPCTGRPQVLPLRVRCAESFVCANQVGRFRPGVVTVRVDLFAYWCVGDQCLSNSDITRTERTRAWQVPPR